METREHWERLYATKPLATLSWYQLHAERSLSLIRSTGVPLSASIIDVGGGASTLVDDLLEAGFSALTVLDLSAAALAAAQARLGVRASAVRWLEADVTRAVLPRHAYDVWHDRALFHFFTSAEERLAYLRTAVDALRPGGHLIIATFAEDGPMRCSGLPVARYGVGDLQAALGPAFTLLKQEREAHATPSGLIQSFIYCHFRRALME